MKTHRWILIILAFLAGGVPVIAQDQTVKTIVVKNRVYCIRVLMPRDDPNASDTKVYEKLSMKFINSFNLMKEAVKQEED